MNRFHLRWLYRIGLFIAAFLTMKRALFFDGYTDFNVYYEYATKVRETWFGTTHPSFGVDPANTSPFRYLPIWGAVFLPFSLVPMGIARALFVGWQWLLYAYVLKRTRKLFLLKPLHEFLLLVGTFRFAFDNAKIGQVSCLLLYLLWWAIPHTWNSRGRARHLALAVSLKLQPVGLLLVPLARRQIGFFIRFALVASLLVACSFAIGSDAVESWLQLSFNSLGVLDPNTVGNQSLYGGLLNLSPVHAKKIFAGILALTALLLFQIWKRLGKPSQLGWIMGIAFLPVFGILTWKNTYVLSVLPFGFLFSQGVSAAAILAICFQLLSQGVIGTEWNAKSLDYGILAWVAWIGWTVGFIQVYRRLKISTKASKPPKT